MAPLPLMILPVVSGLAFVAWRPRAPLVGIRRHDVLLVSETGQTSENEAFHAAECRQSEDNFFAFSSDVEPDPSLGASVAWESFTYPGQPGSGIGIDSKPIAPFGVTDLARVSRKPLFTAADCAAIIREAEEHRSWRGAP